MALAGSNRQKIYPWSVGLAAIFGLALSFGLWREARSREELRRDADFERQVSSRHALIRETLGGYEDCLLGLRLLLTHYGAISQAEFAEAVKQQLTRHPGFLGVQWAPEVAVAERADWEKSHRTAIPNGIRERTRGGSDIVAGMRDRYFPIVFAEPYESNRHVIGSDIIASPLKADVERAFATDGSVMSGRLKLVYETGPNDGVVMICPVYLPKKDGEPRRRGSGVLLGVFRVADLLAQPWNRAGSRRLDVMFVDESATQASRRMLFCHLADGGTVPTEAQFLAGIHRDVSLPIAGRNWRIFYRPANGPGSDDGSFLPMVVLTCGLVITGLGTAFLSSRLRRTALIEQQVHDRTAELTESRRQLSSLMQSLPGMAFRCRYDDSLTVLFASDGTGVLTGWAPEEFVSGAMQFRDVIHPEDLPHVRENTRKALAERSDFEQIFRIRTRAGVERWMLSRGRGVYGPDGKLEMFEGLVIDITAQKLAEQERLTLERRLLDGQKLESLGLLAGGIAHDFNNLLATVIGNSNLLRLDPSLVGSASTKLDAIENAAQRASDLCRQMLAYAGKGRFVIEAVDVSSLVENLVPLLDVSVAKQAHLRLALARELPPIRADATQVRQIVMNLVLNAADAVGERGGEIAISTGIMIADSALLRGCPVGADLMPGNFVFLEVRDSGCGMTAEVKAKIFDPFFSTKLAGRGLGLAATLGIVRGHGGALLVDSTPGVGSTFRLLLPAARGAFSVQPPPVLKSGDWKFTGRALVIDDDEPVRIVAAGMLKSIGASVQTAPDGQSGIELFRSNPAEFDVVLLDLLMPGMTGEETLKVLRTLRADLRVLVISGFSDSDVMQRLAHDRGPFIFLHKPFTRAALIAALRQLLG